MSITKIVLTGGPCGGKSTALNRLEPMLSSLGYTVFTIAETATELNNGGIKPTTFETKAEFQALLFRLQLDKERVFEQAAQKLAPQNIIILCDRGAMDNKGYAGEEAFVRILQQNNTDEASVKNSYHAVFHLVTAANGAVEYYTTQNNSARTETPEEAIALDNAMLTAWEGHPYIRVFDNSVPFDEKINRLLHEIILFLEQA